MLSPSRLRRRLSTLAAASTPPEIAAAAEFLDTASPACSFDTPAMLISRHEAYAAAHDGRIAAMGDFILRRYEIELSRGFRHSGFDARCSRR